MATGIVQGHAPRCSNPSPATDDRVHRVEPFTAPVLRPGDAPKPIALSLEPVPTMPTAVTRNVMTARLGLPPNRPVTAPTTLPVLRQTLAQTQLSPLASITGDLFGSPTPFVAPGVYIPGLGGGARPLGALLNLRYYAALLYDTHTRPGGYAVGVGYLSAAYLGGFGIFTHGAMAHSLFGLIGNGFLNLGSSRYVVSPGALQVMTFNINGWRDYLGAGFQYVYADTASHLLGLVSVGAAKIARRDLINMGPYRGPEADRLAESHGLAPGTPLRKLELRSRTGESYSMRFGGGMYLLSAIMRLDLSRTRERAYRTFVGPERACELLVESGGPIRKLLREKVRALGWAHDPARPPDIHDPYALPVGDEVGLTRSRNFIIGALLGNLGGWIGYNITFRKDLEIAVRRFGEHRVEVILTPVRVRAPQVYMVSPFGPHVSSRKSHAQALRYGMVFDLRDPAALEAFHHTVDGDPPGLGIHDTRPHLQNASACLAETLQEQQEALPSGVHYTFLQLFDAEAQDVGLGIKWMLIPKEVIPRGWETGLTYHLLHGREDQAVTDGEQTLTSSGRSATATAELAWSGVRTTQAGATQRWETFPNGQRLFLGLDLQAHVSESNGVLGDFAEHFVKNCNKYFGLRLSAPVHAHPREDRQTHINRVLGEEAVSDLASIAAPAAREVEEAGILRAMDAARRANTPYHPLLRMLRAMAAEEDVDERNALIQTYVQKRGLRGFAAVHRLLGGDPADLAIRSASSTYDEALTKGDLLGLQFNAPPAEDASPSDLAKRWRALAHGLQAIQHALDGIADDGLLDAEARKGLRTALWAVRARLQAALPQVPEQVEAMRTWCEQRLWQRAWHRQLLTATEDPTPLLQHSWDLANWASQLPNDLDSWCARWEALNQQADALESHLSALQELRGVLPPAAYDAQCAQLTAALELLAGPAPRLPRGGLLALHDLPEALRLQWAEALEPRGPYAELRTMLMVG